MGYGFFVQLKCSVGVVAFAELVSGCEGKLEISFMFGSRCNLFCIWARPFESWKLRRNICECNVNIGIKFVFTNLHKMKCPLVLVLLCLCLTHVCVTIHLILRSSLWYAAWLLPLSNSVPCLQKQVGWGPRLYCVLSVIIPSLFPHSNEPNSWFLTAAINFKGKCLKFSLYSEYFCTVDANGYNSCQV